MTTAQRRLTPPTGRVMGIGASKGVVFMLVITILAFTVFCEDVDARGRRHRGRSRGRSAAAAAAAKKQQMIQAIQRQIAQAQKILAVAESQTAMSQEQVNQTLAELSSLHSGIEAAHLDAQETAKTLRAIEQEILDEQSPDSDFARAQAALEQAKRALHEIVHSYARLPDDSSKSDDGARYAELARLSPADRKAIEADSGYQRARLAVEAAGKALDGQRRRLFEQDSEWKAVQRDLLEAQKSARESSRQAGTVGLGSLGDRQDLRQAQRIVAQARAIILQGEQRLRALGVRSTGPATASRSKR